MSDPITRLNAALEGRYTIDRELGAGGMATVYLAHDLKHDRKIALKVLKPELAAVVGAERFLAEIKTTANLQHPHILPLFDSGEADGFLFYVMPYVEGESLRDRLDREGELPIREAVRITMEVADALGYAHRHGTIHRDVKPANILLHEGRALVADFGIALAVSAAGGGRLTETGLSLGTPHYMSPEQATGDRVIDPRSDIYALGCLLYEMLAGRPPHVGSSAQAILAKILTSEPEPLEAHRPSVSPSVADTVARALARLPADRPQTAEEFFALLERPDLPREASGRRPWVTVVGLPLVVIAAFVSGIFLPSGDRPEPGRAPVRRQVTYVGGADNPSLSPDGSRVAYADYRCEAEYRCRFELSLQDLTSGGNPVVIEPFDEPYGSSSDWYWSVEWSPSGDQLIVTRMRSDTLLTGVYVMPPLGGAPRMLRAEIATSAVFRPDGRTVDWIAWPDGFVSGTGVWRTLDLDTDSVTSRPLSVHGTHTSWAPTGRWMAMIGRPWSGSASRPFLSLWGADGQLADTLTGPWGATGWPNVSWTGEGEAVLFIAGGNVYRVGVDPQKGEFDRTSEQVQEGLDHPGWLESRFSTTADGRKLAWAHPTQRTRIRTLDARGGSPTVRTLDLGTAWADYPAVSLDGERLAYLREDYGGFNVYVRSFSEGAEQQLTASSLVKRNLEWSPDGRYLAFLESDGVDDWLSVVPTSVAQPRRLARLGAWMYGQRFSWWPDSGSLVFVTPEQRLGRVDLEGSAEDLFALPDSVGILWDVLVAADGSSLATLSHVYNRGGSRFLVYTAPIQTGAWSLRSAVLQSVFDGRMIPSRGPPGWRSQTPLHWKADGTIELAVGLQTGSGATSTIWSWGEGDHRRLLMDVAAVCGAPTVVSTSWDGSRLACVQREILTDIWIMDGVVPGHR